MTTWMLLLGYFSALAYAVLGGVFLAFSDFIMRALSVTSGTGGVEAMNAINREVYRYLFMSLFIGMVPVSLILAGGAYFAATEPAPFFVAALIYLVGVFVVTAAGNVPMNKMLATIDIASADGLRYWTENYLPGWTFWNSVRSAACLLASVVLMYGLARPVMLGNMASITP